MSKIWKPPDPDDWGVVLDIEPAFREVALPDGRVMRESRLILSEQAMDELWHGYRCARCLERLEVSYPEECPNDWCRFPIRKLQRQQLERDFVDEIVKLRAGIDLDREYAYLEETHHVKRPQISVPKEIEL